MARVRSSRTGVEMTVADNLRVGLPSEWEPVDESKSEPKKAPVKKAPVKKAAAKKADK